jgi:hypothetical protein
MFRGLNLGILIPEANNVPQHIQQRMARPPFSILAQI